MCYTVREGILCLNKSSPDAEVHGARHDHSTCARNLAEKQVKGLVLSGVARSRSGVAQGEGPPRGGSGDVQAVFVPRQAAGSRHVRKVRIGEKVTGRAVAAVSRSRWWM